MITPPNCGVEFCESLDHEGKLILLLKEQEPRNKTKREHKFKKNMIAINQDCVCCRWAVRDYKRVCMWMALLHLLELLVGLWGVVQWGHEGRSEAEYPAN